MTGVQTCALPICSSVATKVNPAPVALDVPFIGLFGPQGVLPQHYTQLVIDRTRKKDFSLRDFLDIFNHRVISYFYRAWEKYRFAIGYERALLKQESDPAADEDLFTSCLFSLVGMAPPSLRGRMDFPDRILLYYAAHFTQRTRTAWALGAMVQDYFDVPTRIEQFRGQWLYLSRENQSKLSVDVDADHLNNRLGMDVIVGDRVWSVENKFRVRLGPLTYPQFRRFTPFGDRLHGLGQFVRTYVGPEFDFEFQPILRAAEAFGATGAIFLKGSVNPYNPKCVRGSAGSIFRLPVVIENELPALDGIALYAAMPRADRDIDQADFRKPCAIVIGSEGRGVRDSIAARATALRIPTSHVESLNAAVAAGVLLCEARRQRGAAGRSASR